MRASLLPKAAHNNVQSQNERNSTPPVLGILTLALTVSAAACLARLVLDPWLGPYQPLTLGLAAVAIAAWFGTWRAGIVTAVICQFCLSYVFVVPDKVFDFFSGGWLVNAATFYLTAGVVLVVNHGAAAARHELAVTVDALRQRDARKAEGLALLGHELRNPLASFRMGVEVLRRNMTQDAASRRTADMMERQVLQMVRLLNDILDISRIDRGKIQLRFRSISVESLVAEAISAAATFTGPKKQCVRAAVAANVGFIDADPDRVSQILANLLHNASKFSPSGSTIDVYAGPAPSGVLITVRDEGVGIAPEQLDLIFDAFSQVHSGEQGGLGLGLALVRKLMEMHQGTAEVQSAGPGKGAEFTLTFPRARRPGSSWHPGRRQCSHQGCSGQDEQQEQPGPAQFNLRTITPTHRQSPPSAFIDQSPAMPISLAVLDEALESSA